MIHMFDLMPGASRQSEATSIQHKINLTEISVCRAGNQEDQYIVFIDEHRDLFCATVKRIQNQDDEIYKIGNFVRISNDFLLFVASFSKLYLYKHHFQLKIKLSDRIFCRYTSTIVYVGK